MKKQENRYADKVGIFLDSGAYSAWTQGTKVEIDEYIKFALENMDNIELLANLDVIPGSPGSKLTKEDIENSAAQGWKNYDYMLAHGIPKEKLIHVFHYGEDFKWLERMVEEIPYIGLAPGTKRTTNQKIEWIDDCMPYVTDENDIPKVKVHGFGVTSHALLVRYPWYSVDSTSWVMTGCTGSITVPRHRNGDWCYEDPPWIVSVSGRSPTKEDRGAHIDSMPPRQRQLIIDYIESKGYLLGESSFKTVAPDYKLQENELWNERKPKDKNALRKVVVIEVEGVSNRYPLRDEMNIAYYQDLEAHLPKWPWAFKAKTIQRLL